ncbi:MAG: alpha/beta hydrolase [Actinomycetota bacterium]|nr:alpha/beta hydrolase [Actinomycetota bacterium]
MSRRRIGVTASILLVLGSALGGLAACTDRAGIGVSADAVQSTSPLPTRPSPPSGSAPAPSQTKAGAVSVDRDIVYREAGGEQLRLDVCRRARGADGPRPAVLLIHGGAFVAGDKDTPKWQELCSWLAESGYVAVNLNYRLAPVHRFPAAIEDIQAAVEWTRANALTYGVDPDRVGVLGGSAGANLAQLLGTSGAGSTSLGSRVAAVVSLSGAADLTERALTLGDPEPTQIRRVLDYLGCVELTACPAGAPASPITQVDPSDPPFLLAQSEEESLPVEQTEVMADALTEVGAQPEVLIRAGRAHATGLLDDPSVNAAVLAFLARTLG